MVVLHAGAWAVAAATIVGVDIPGSLTLLDAACIVIIVGCVLTMAIRLNRILDALDARATGANR